MKLKTVLLFLLLTVLILSGIPDTFARPLYLQSLTNVYGDGSCQTCHVTSGKELLNSYGTLFLNQANHAADPATALKEIGKPPVAAATPAVAATLTTTSQQTPEITKEIPDEEETQEETEDQEDRETNSDLESQTRPTASVPAKATPASAGFGIMVSLVGLFICALLVRRNNN